MRLKRSVFFTILLAFALCLPAWAGLSEQDFLQKARAAALKKDSKTFLSLFNFKNADPEMMAMAKSMTREILNAGVSDLRSAKPDLTQPTEFVVNGFRYFPNAKILGYAALYSKKKNAKDENGTITNIPYGEIDGGYAFLCNSKERI